MSISKSIINKFWLLFILPKNNKIIIKRNINNVMILIFINFITNNIKEFKEYYFFLL